MTRSGRMRAVLLAAFLTGTVSGCVTPLPDLSQSRSPCLREPGGWCGFVRDAAVETYRYAMLASNAYRDDDSYVRLPPDIVARDIAENDGSGLAFSIFDRFEMVAGERGPLQARIIAFRGTEAGSAKDIFSGTIGDKQRDGARATFARQRAALDAEGMTEIPIEVTGHSLGGALATQISIDNPAVKAFVFNSSPFFEGEASINAGNRTAVSERGEFLRRLRQYRRTPAADMFILNCDPAATATAKHGIRSLADCLTWIAAYEDDTAHALIVPNGIDKPAIECGDPDKTHPGPRATADTVCVHGIVTDASD
ncbi:MAG: hypothetical protein WA948_03565 [Pontixanthobacter sp.]